MKAVSSFSAQPVVKTASNNTLTSTLRFSSNDFSLDEDLLSLSEPFRDPFDNDSAETLADTIPDNTPKAEKRSAAKTVEERLEVDYQGHLDSHGVKGQKQLLKGLKKTKELLTLYPEAEVQIGMKDYIIEGKQQTSGKITIDVGGDQTVKHEVDLQILGSQVPYFVSQRKFINDLNNALEDLLTTHFEKRFGFVHWLKQF